MHVPGNPLILTNAWDPGTAKIVEDLGFRAVATSSAAVALSLGFADKQVMPVDIAFRALQWICESVDVPVTADLESGYGLEMDDLAQRIRRAGAVGLNFEDSDHVNGGLLPGEVHAQRIADLRAVDADLVINARMDVHLVGDGDLDEGLARARMYREAGADCVFAPAVVTEDAITAYVEAVGIVNVLVFPGLPPRERLAELGVARISLGSSGYHAAMKAFRTQAREYTREASE